MRKYIARRLLLFIPTLFGVSLVVFFLMRIVPGDVAAMMLAGPSGEAPFTQEELAELREELGLDRPLITQYFEWLWRMARLDLGESLLRNRPVWDELKERFPITLELAVLTMIVVTAVAIPIGVLAAIRQDTWVDYILRGWAILGLAMPSFWVGLLVVLVLSYFFRWLPPLGFVHLWDNPAVGFQQLMLPAVALGFHLNGYLLRMTRAQMLEVLREDYIRTARAKGLREQIVIIRHALRNALLPVVTIAGVLVGLLLSGSVVIEIIFNLPGMGRAIIAAIFNRDFPIIEVFVLFIAVVYLTINLLVDLLYAWLDPRIRYA